MEIKAFLEIQIDKFGKKNWRTVDSQDKLCYTAGDQREKETWMTLVIA